jgi:voltage-gated potassium channel
MVAVVQLVEHQVVILAVAGSSPVSHPEQNARPEFPVGRSFVHAVGPSCGTVQWMTRTEEPASDNRRVWPALLRPLGAMIVLLAGYFALPSEPSPGALVIGCLAVVAVCTWEVRHFIRSTRPVETAIEMLAAGFSLYLIGFSASYFLMSVHSPGAFAEPLTRVDAIYYCLTVFTTTGFGDIVPITQGARIVTSLQMASSLILLGLGVRFVTVMVKERLAERGHEHRA